MASSTFDLPAPLGPTRQSDRPEFADVGYVLVGGRLVKAGYGKELLTHPGIGRLFLGG